MKNTHNWSIILAGGDGQRTRPFIKNWLGFHRPKQYCRFVGTRSLFQHTLDRADRLTTPEHKVAVIARSHLHEAGAQLEGRGCRLIVQPHNCGTAAGIFLPLAHIYAADPDATVVVYPSDHFVYPEETFAHAVATALEAAERISRKIILLGAVPDGPEDDYGWIMPGDEYSRFPAYPLRTVRSFLEKPGPSRSEFAHQAGGLWNTFILVAKASVIWKLGWYLLPEMMIRFDRILKAIKTPHESGIVEEAYETMPVWDFSMHVLQRAPRQLAVMEMSGIYWSDWGRPERIESTLRRIGKQPLFPVESLRPVEAVYTQTMAGRGA